MDVSLYKMEVKDMDIPMLYSEFNYISDKIDSINRKYKTTMMNKYIIRSNEKEINELLKKLQNRYDEIIKTGYID